jgi:hypothetical protein
MAVFIHGPRIHENASEVLKVALIKSSSRAMQRQVDLTTAVCQERLLATHVAHVLALVDLVADRVPFDDALDIYVRVLRLTPEQARNVGSRALAELGRREREMGQKPRVAPALVEREEEPIEETDSSGRSDVLFARLRRRVRGRVQEDLRHRINLAAARTEDELLETHVENSLLFARALAEDMAEPEAVELYLETMMLSEGTADVIYHRALRRVADEVLPPLSGSPEGRALERAERGVGVPAEEARP